MNCEKCGKEIQNSEKKLCENCQKKKIKLSIIFASIIILIVLSVLLFCITGKEKTGNTIGNIRNYGYAVEDNGWIYYLAPNEEGVNVGIFKIKPNKKNEEPKEILMKDWKNILSINASKNYIYFIAISKESYNEEDLVDNKIYRMKNDGTALEVINDNEFNNNCYEIYVIDNKIYYIGVDSNIYKMNIDGSKKELVSENGTGYLGITEKYIIYNVENKEKTDYVTHIMDLNGKNTRPIIENTRLYSVNIDKDYIYYTNEAKQICRIKIDGTENQIMYDTTAYNMNANGKYIYYLNYTDEVNKDYRVNIYKVRKDGKTETPEPIKMLDKISSFIDIVGDWVIYMDYNEQEGFINLVKIDGTDEKRLYSLPYEEIETEESANSESVSENTEASNEVKE